MFTRTFPIDTQYRKTLSLNAGLQNVAINASHLSFLGQSLGLFWDRNERNGLTSGIGYKVHVRNYKTRFPALAYGRHDRVSDIITSASHKKFKFRDLHPKLRCTLRDHGSNVALYDYKSTDCSISFDYQF